MERYEGVGVDGVGHGHTYTRPSSSSLLLLFSWANFSSLIKSPHYMVQLFQAKVNVSTKTQTNIHTEF